MPSLELINTFKKLLFHFLPLCLYLLAFILLKNKINYNQRQVKIRRTWNSKFLKLFTSSENIKENKEINSKIVVLILFLVFRDYNVRTRCNKDLL